MKGRFITFEGVEGSGKSTQIKLLAQRLTEAGTAVLATREPGGTAAGIAVRSILLNPETGTLDPVTELLLFSAARRELVVQVIKPALERGEVVLCDRFSDSTMAYQGFGRELEFSAIDGLVDIATEGVRPDATIILDLPVEQGLKRTESRMEAEGRDESRFENEALEFHNKVRAGFLEIAGKDPERVRVVEAGKPVEEVQNALIEVLADILPELALKA